MRARFCILVFVRPVGDWLASAISSSATDLAAEASSLGGQRTAQEEIARFFSNRVSQPQESV